MDGLLYEPNPKHKLPWQAGRKGALRPAWSHQIAQDLLSSSVLSDNGKKRYSTREGVAFSAQMHSSGVWHGYPVAWVEVPQVIWRKWAAEGLVKKQQIRDSWHDYHDQE